MLFEVCDPGIFFYASYLVVRIRPEKFRPEQDSNPDLSDAAAWLHQLSFQANWEPVVLWVDYKPVDDEYRSIILYMMLIHESHVSDRSFRPEIFGHSSLLYK